MSCDEFEYSPTGRQGIGVIQPQSGLDYPFVSPSADVQALFADFFLSYDEPAHYIDGAEPFTLPFRVSWLSGFGCDGDSSISAGPHDADLVIVDADERVVFDSTAMPVFTVRDWGTDYRIYEWETEDTDLTAVCRCVVYTAWSEGPEPEPRNYPSVFEPENAVLDARTIQILPKRGLALTVATPTTALGTVRTRTSTALCVGYNMQIIAGEMTSVEQVRDTEILFAAVPGTGLGRYDECETLPSPAIVNINGAGADDYGGLLLPAKDCSYVRQPTTRTEVGGITPDTEDAAAILTIGDDCPPCCDCPDYVNIAKYMNRLHKRYALIGERVKETRSVYKQNRKRWLDRYECALQNPIRALVVPQYCPYVDLVMIICNPFDECLKNVRLTGTVTTDQPASAILVCGYTELHAPGVTAAKGVDIQGGYPTYSVDFPPIPKSASAYVKFRLKFSPKAPILVEFDVTGEAGSPAEVIGTGHAEDTLNCDNMGNNTQPC